MLHLDQHTDEATTQSLQTTLVTTRRAFTLVELLVVIGIIAVLISILLPALSRARESANQVKCMANLRTIGQAMMIYTNQNKGMLPMGQVANGDAVYPNGGSYPGPSVSWTILLAQIISKNAGDGYADQQSKTGSDSNGPYLIFQCPTAPKSNANSILTHYSSHPRLIPNLADKDWYLAFTPPFPNNTHIQTFKLARIRRAAEIVAIFDATVSNEIGNGTYTAHVVGDGLDFGGYKTRVFMQDNYNISTNTTNINAGTPVDTRRGNGSFNPAIDYNADTTNNMGNIRFRHNANKGANCLMFDGHVTSFAYNPGTHQTDMQHRNIDANR